MAGEVASTVLSRMTVPVLYYLSERGGGEARRLEETFGSRIERGGQYVMNVDRYLRLIAGAIRCPHSRWVIGSARTGFFLRRSWA